MQYRGKFEKVQSARVNAPIDVETGGFTDSFEQSGFGCRHPHLPASREPFEQNGAAVRIEMGGHFVEQQDRRLAAPLSDEIGMSED